jgi:hypothetical protein
MGNSKIGQIKIFENIFSVFGQRGERDWCSDTCLNARA